MAYRYFINISFCGTGFHGWQIQKNTGNTVQACLQDGLSRIFGAQVSLTSCCRTDTGVHAREMFVHFDLEKNLNKSKQDWIYKINAILPKSVAVKEIYSAPDSLHARFDARSRSYVYRLHQNRDPFLNDQSYYYYGKLDVKKMNQAAKLLLKHQDFKSFSKVKTQVQDHLCRIRKAEWKEYKDGTMTFIITSDRFLRGMVRMIVGTLLEIGKGRKTKKDLERILQAGDNRMASALAPARGLYLYRVSYPPGKLKKL